MRHGGTRAFAAAAALLLAGVFTVGLLQFLERDACLDAGGRFDAGTGRCAVADGVDYVPLAERSAPWLWLAIVASTGVVAWIAYVAIGSLTRRIIRGVP